MLFWTVTQSIRWNSAVIVTNTIILDVAVGLASILTKYSNSVMVTVAS